MKMTVYTMTYPQSYDKKKKQFHNRMQEESQVVAHNVRGDNGGNFFINIESELVQARVTN